ncbi:MAG: DEAD/DEAH box helicase family protein [Planctomycetota bacterium]
MEPRRWQADARKVYFDAVERTKNFLAYVTPSAGKTFFATSVASDLMQESLIRQIAVVTHTHNLRTQWIDDAYDWGMLLGPLDSPGEHGFVVTYQQLADSDVAESVGLLTGRASRPTLMIGDEIHHASDQQSWGRGLRTGFARCFRRMVLSGTPFRRDEARLPFVEYRNGIARPSFSYGYSQGLADGIVAPVFFPTFDGRAKWRHGDREYHDCASNLGSMAAADRHLNTLLTSPDWLGSVLRAANEQLDELRAYQPNAAGIVTAIDQSHARSIVKMLNKIAGRDNVQLAISDESDAHSVIDEFKSRGKWLVAVRMVSEGVNIKRARVGVYATNIRTELFFRQFVGRFTRVDDSFDDQSAFVFLPAHPELQDFARELAEDRYSVLRTTPRVSRGGGGPRVNVTELLGAGAAIEASTLAAGAGDFDAGELKRADEVRKAAGLGHLPVPVVAQLLRAASVGPITEGAS